jgi:putative ABC transport system permease protein
MPSPTKLRLARIWIGEIWRRFRFMAHRRDLAGELDEEIRLHLELGARYRSADSIMAAKRRIGKATRLKEASRETWTLGAAFGAIFQDAKYGLRSLAKAPRFTALSALTLALGIGSSTAVFSLIDAILLESLPYPDAERIVLPWHLPPAGANLGFDEYPWGITEFHRFERELRTFEHLGAFKSDSFNLTGSGEPEMISGMRASAGFFAALGVSPALGRIYSSEEDRTGREYEAVLSHSLWRDLFGGDRKILGRSVKLNGFAYTVVGVMPPRFAFPRAAEMPGSFNFPREPKLWVPLAMPEVPKPSQPEDLAVIGRLKPGISLAQAQAEMDVCSYHLDQMFPKAVGWFRGHVVSLNQQAVGDTRRPLLLMFAAVSIVLLIACSNVANLVLIRSLARGREFTLRAALGAGRERIVGQLFTESLVLGSVAGLVGLGLAAVELDLAKAFGPQSIPRLGEATLNMRVFAFTFAIALATGALFGLAPAVDAARQSVATTLKEGARGTAGGSAPAIRNVLLVFQVALAMVLVIAAGLLMRSFREILRVEPGFNPRSVLSFTLSLPPSKYDSADRVTRLFDDLLGRLRRIHGVEAAGIGETIPMGGVGESTVIMIPGRLTFGSPDKPIVVYTIASPGYFSAVGTPLLRGRTLAESDTAQSTPVTVISKTMAEKLWPGGDSIGRKVGLGSPRFPLMTIVGIVADVKHLSLREVAAPEMYVPYTQKPYPSMLAMRVVVRTSGDPLAAANYVREALRRADADLPVAEMTTLCAVVDRSLTQPRFSMLLMAGFGTLAVVLASVGIYGVVSYSVTRRTQEIGIRMALGAARRDVFRMILGQGICYAILGTAIGIIAALALTPLMTSFLYSVRPADPLTFAAVSALLIAIALAACYIPARRATKIDPIVALRLE